MTQHGRASPCIPAYLLNAAVLGNSVDNDSEDEDDGVSGGKTNLKPNPRKRVHSLKSGALHQCHRAAWQLTTDINDYLKTSLKPAEYV